VLRTGRPARNHRLAAPARFHRYCIEAAGLEAAVLDREPGGEAVELGDDPVLEVEDRILAHRAAAFLEQPSKHGGWRAS